MKKSFICFLMALQFLVAGPAIAQSPSGNCNVPGNKKFVPNVLGLAEADAQKAVEDCGLEWSFSDKPGTLSYEAIGTMGRQVPAGGAVVDRGSTVRGFVSRGFMIPSYVSQHRSVAEAALLDLGLNVVVVTRRDPTPLGTIVAQSPAGGEMFNSGTPIEITVSEGPWLILPNVRGKQYHPASNELAALGVVPVHGGGSLESGQQSITICEKHVWYPVVDFTDPAAGARIFEGDTVRVHTKRRDDFLLLPPPKGKICP